MKVKSFRFFHSVVDEEVNDFIKGKQVHDIKLSSISYVLGSNYHIEHTVLVLYE